MLDQLEKDTQGMTLPLIDQVIDIYGKDPYLILIACLLSLRAKDSVTIHVVKKLFARASNPYNLIDLPLDELQSLIYSTNYYKTKSHVLRHVSHVLINEYNGHVPRDKDQLLSIKGIGPKTANLVVGQAFNTPAICVDTHVHRLANQLGWVSTRTPLQTEKSLEKVVHKKDWIRLNTLLVMWGQNKGLKALPQFDPL
jgi:endonuclease-3